MIYLIDTTADKPAASNVLESFVCQRKTSRGVCWVLSVRPFLAGARGRGGRFNVDHTCGFRSVLVGRAK